MLQEEIVERQIDDTTFSGTSGYTERVWSEYEFESSFSWLDESWEQSRGTGQVTGGAEDGTGWNISGTFVRRYGSSTGSDGVTGVQENKGTANPGDLTASGSFTEFGFESFQGGAVTTSYVYDDGDWEEMAPRIIFDL